jgi:hypothetical protein
LGIAHSPFGCRIERSRFDLIGADAPETTSAVQISGKNVDANIMMGNVYRGGARNQDTLGCFPQAEWRQPLTA